MRIADLLERRRQGWVELETLCNGMQKGRMRFRGKAAEITRFSALYRAACTDLAMAEQYQLPPATVEYLHRLVGRAHSQLYRSTRPRLDRFLQYVFQVIPHAVFRDPCVMVAALLFFGSFGISAYMAYNSPKAREHAELVLGAEQVEELERMHSSTFGTDNPTSAGSFYRSAFYINNNAGIGLQCFCLGPLVLPTLAMLLFNGFSLGTAFGYMGSPEAESSANFFHFVMAHGALELTAIALAAAAGMRIGVGLFSTGGYSRGASFRLNAERALPIVLCSFALFIMAAFTEGCLSPSEFYFDFLIKVMFAIGSSKALCAYFLVLGWPTSARQFALQGNTDNPWRIRDAA